MTQQERSTITKNISVTKRDGSVEPFDIEKIHKMVEIACENITGVSMSDVEMTAQLSFYDGIESSEIHRALIKAATELITEKTPNYQYVAGRLLNFDIRKYAWGSVNPPRLYDHIVRMVENEYYTEQLLEMYTEEEWDKFENIIDHDRDLKMSYIGVKEYLTKYAVRDRSLDSVVPLETPQITYILIAALMRSDSKKFKDVKSYYNDISLHNFSLPTPIMGGMRTQSYNFSSCVLIECDDSLNSIVETNGAIQKYISKKAGIGVSMTALRAEGSAVSKKTIKHTGLMPFLKQVESTVKSCSQGGIRGGAATVNLLLWHLDVEEMLVLKNNKGTPDTRVRKLDYAYHINNFLYQKLINDEDITLFSPHETRDLYEAFYEDPKEFEKLYKAYEKNSNVRKKTIPAMELFSKMMTERKETGRIYVVNVDNFNSHSAFIDPVKMTNLCVEISLVTTPMGSEEKYNIYVKEDELLETINELSNSDIVNSFRIVGEAA